jgi:hypothetical protein
MHDAVVQKDASSFESTAFSANSASHTGAHFIDSPGFMGLTRLVFGRGEVEKLAGSLVRP